jgi:hypothetical protein
MIIDSQKFWQICNDVWREREGILNCKGILTGEAALLRAVYWRLCKVGGKPSKRIDDCDMVRSSITYKLVVDNILELCGHPRFDSAPFLDELINRYRQECERII